MIGLGSNRLSVCRRGGMSVTQAGRGGMEWLAGGRVPSWANPYLPYSKAAGEALVAQFPTQWPTIRDYGFAHPEIVGYMNAYAPEDAKIAYSLVEGIGTRWIRTDDGAHIDTGFKATDYAHSYQYDVTWKTAQSSGGSIIGTIANNAGFGQIFVNGSISQLWGGVGNQNTNLNAALALDTKYVDSVKFDFDAGKVTRITDGVSQINTHNISTRPSTSAFLYAYNNGGSPAQKTKCSFAKVVMYGDGVKVREMYPFIRNGVNGMIDVLSGTFYQNAGSGSFTISETPAS